MPEPPRRKSDRPRFPRFGSPNAKRIALAVIALALVILALSMRAIATFWTDYLWFQSVDLSSIWQRLLGAKVVLSVITGLTMFLLLWVNLNLADRLAPRFLSGSGPDDEILMRYREVIGGRKRIAWFVLSLAVALIPAASASSQWRNWLLFRNGGDFGIKDPQFHTDIGFYVFKLPFLSMIADWMFGFLMATIVIVAIVHYLNGAIHIHPIGERITPNAKAHLSVLLALAAFVKAGDYWLRRYELVVSPGKSFDGAGYADVKASLPAMQLMILISIFAGVMLIVNIRRKGWTVPAIILALWGLVAIIAGGLFPAFVQRFQVTPAELSKERPYIERNISATRDALDLSRVKDVKFNYSADLSDQDVADGQENLDNARLLDPTVVLPTIQDQQVEREYYRFFDVDVDRYPVDEVQTPVVVSARELNLKGVTNESWEKLHLVFTHGYAASIAPANQVNSRGEPKFLMHGIPVQSTQIPELKRPEIYVGEGMEGYSIVDTKQTELSSDDVTTRYDGKAGVELGSAFRKAAFALRFGQIEPLISGSVTDNSKVIYNRDVVERVREVAPFLEFDPDPYPVLIDGRVKYIVDAYTTTTSYPYAQRIQASEVQRQLDGSFNYIRNSAKAVVDAYDGTVKFYLSDELYDDHQDPIVRAYARAFPGLFETEIPSDVRAHLRYPEFMFKAQTVAWGRYHQSDPSTFLNNSDRWVIALQPSSSGSGTVQADQGSTSDSSKTYIEPYYQQLKIGSATTTQFVLTRPFVLTSSDDVERNLTSVMIARMDPEHYGQLEQITMVSKKGDKTERTNSVDGPVQANRKMATYGPVTEFQTLAGQQGSTISYGNTLILPMGNALMYLRPIYVAQEQSTRFTLKKVVMISGESVGFGDTIEMALADLRDSNPDGIAAGSPVDGNDGGPDSEVPDGGSSTTTTTPPGKGPQSAEELIAAADAKFDAADERLRAADIAGYSKLVNEARQLVAEASALLNEKGAATSSTTTTTAKSPTTTTTTVKKATG